MSNQILAEELLDTSLEPGKTLAQIAAEQGKKPLKFEELRRLGRFFPADESVDELVNSVYAQRNETGDRRID